MQAVISTWNHARRIRYQHNLLSCHKCCYINNRGKCRMRTWRPSLATTWLCKAAKSLARPLCLTRPWGPAVKVASASGCKLAGCAPLYLHEQHAFGQVDTVWLTHTGRASYRCALPPRLHLAATLELCTTVLPRPSVDQA